MQFVSVDRAKGDSTLARSFSAQIVTVDNATGDNTIIPSLSASLYGYDIGGVVVVVPENKTNIIRVK